MWWYLSDPSPILAATRCHVIEKALKWKAFRVKYMLLFLQV